jgi:hypothetical protein
MSLSSSKEELASSRLRANLLLTTHGSKIFRAILLSIFSEPPTGSSLTSSQRLADFPGYVNL